VLIGALLHNPPVWILDEPMVIIGVGNLGRDLND